MGEISALRIFSLSLQVSRAIGDAYLKKAEFNREPLASKFRLPEPFEEPIISAEPSILVHKLYPEDQFLIFASDGLWEHLSNEEAVDIVQNYPRHVRIHFSLQFGIIVLKPFLLWQHK